jgi:hypothetical protein
MGRGMTWAQSFEYVLANLEDFEAYQDAGLIPRPTSPHAELEEQKARARQAVNDAVKKGTLIRQPCAICGALEADGHHPDYSKPLDVIWLCPPHHRSEHIRLKTSGEQ